MITATHYASHLHPGMFFRKRMACDSLAMDTPMVPINEITADPYASEGKRLAVEDRQRRHHELVHGVPARYFDWRQSIGNAYYDEQDRISGRVASNDNTPPRRMAA